jgi:hypothetical protein
MSMWALILFAAVGFGVSFALAHFTERLLLAVVGRAGARKERGRSSPSVRQEFASSDAGAGRPISSEQIRPASAATSSAQQDELKGTSDAERPQARVHHLRRTATARNPRASARARTYSRAGLHSGGPESDGTPDGEDSHRPPTEPLV